MNAPPKSKSPIAAKRPDHHALYNLSIWRRVKDLFRSRFPMRACICNALDPNGVLRNEKGERICGRPATDVHHLVDHKGNWELFLGSDENFSNLVGLCHRHHSEVTARRNNDTR
jgi:hypothetical protein